MLPIRGTIRVQHAVTLNIESVDMHKQTAVSNTRVNSSVSQPNICNLQMIRVISEHQFMSYNSEAWLKFFSNVAILVYRPGSMYKPITVCSSPNHGVIPSTVARQCYCVSNTCFIATVTPLPFFYNIVNNIISLAVPSK